MTIEDLIEALQKFRSSSKEPIGILTDHGEFPILSVRALKDEDVEANGFKYLIMADD